MSAAAATGTDIHGLEAVLIGIAVMLVVAKLGGELFERMRQPAVLGELFAGILLGNLVILGFTPAEPLKTNATVAALAEFGVIILLFEVGLESDLKRNDRSRLVVVTGRDPWRYCSVFSRLGRFRLFHSGRASTGPHLHWRDSLRNQRRHHCQGFQRPRQAEHP